MALIVTVLAVFVALSLLSGLLVYAYGRFASRTRGDASFALPVEADATPLDRLVAPLVARHRGRSGLKLLDDNLEAFAARAHAARSAARSLDLQYYYWKDDLTGTLLADEVLKAADRGVRVRLLLDDINLRGKDAKYLALDAHENVEVRVFNPCWNRVGALQRGFEVIFRAYSSTRRMHNKAWIADGRLAIVGGRNVGDPYFDASDTMNFRDLDLMVAGPAVEQAEKAFDAFWNSDSVLPIAFLPRLDYGDLGRLRASIARVAASDRAAPYSRRLERSNAQDVLLGGGRPYHWCERAEIISDPPAKANGDRQSRWIYKAIFPVVTSARNHIEITSPYFIPGEEGVRQLTGLVHSGVKVRILTNSLAATDVAAVHGAYARYRAPLARGGVELYELKPEVEKHRMSLFGSSGASLHTKAFTVDGYKGFVGSFNFDPRSVSLNTEMGVLFDHPALAEEVRGVFEEQVTTASYRVALEGGRLVWLAGVGREATRWLHDPAAGWWRRLTAAVVGLLPLESQL